MKTRHASITLAVFALAASTYAAVQVFSEPTSTPDPAQILADMKKGSCPALLEDFKNFTKNKFHGAVTKCVTSNNYHSEECGPFKDMQEGWDDKSSALVQCVKQGAFGSTDPKSKDNPFHHLRELSYFQEVDIGSSHIMCGMRNSPYYDLDTCKKFRETGSTK